MRSQARMWPKVIIGSTLVLLGTTATLWLSLLSYKIESKMIELQKQTEALKSIFSNDITALSNKLEEIELEVKEGNNSQRAKIEASLSSVGKRLTGISDQVVGIRNAPSAYSAVISSSEQGVPVALIDTELDRTLQAAEAAYAERRYDDAAQAYGLLLKTAPSELGFITKRAIASYKANPADSGNYASVEHDLKSSIRKGSKDVEAIEVLALISMEKGNFKEALDNYEELAELRPRDIDILNRAAECAIFAGDKKRAVLFVGMAEAVDADNASTKDLRSRADAMPELEEGSTP